MNKKIKKIAGVALIAGTCLCMALSAGCKEKASVPTANEDEKNPASSTVMTSGQAESLDNSFGVKLYFKTSQENYVIAETALLDFDPDNKKISALAGVILSKLMEGPADLSKLSAVIPQGTEVKNVSFKSGVLKIDVNSAFVEGISQDEAKAKLAVYSVVNTLTELKDVEKVEFTCQGKSIGRLPCGFEFVTFSRDNTIIKTDNSASAGYDDPYKEELFEGVPLE